MEKIAKYFKVVDPERLKDYTEERKKDFEEKELIKFLPELKSKFLKLEKETEVEVFKEYKGIDSVFKDILREMTSSPH